MILISHRGNLSGIDEENENNPNYVEKALNLGYNVEVDVWYIRNEWYLGHDKPQYKIKKIFLKNSKLWCHAKNIKSLQEMLKYNVHCFWHENDKITITSRNFLWHYPTKNLSEFGKKSICLFPEFYGLPNQKIFGICTDFLLNL